MIVRNNDCLRGPWVMLEGGDKDGAVQNVGLDENLGSVVEENAIEMVFG